MPRKSSDQKSSGHLSAAQKARLLELIREKPLLRSGKFSQDFTMKDGQREWEEITNTLNSIPGSNKSWRLWRKTWQDLQSKAKAKKATINKEIKKTGGGPPPDPMDQFEEGVVSLLHNNSVVGHEGVSESVVKFFVEENSEEIPAFLPPPEFNPFDGQQEIEVPCIQPHPEFHSPEDIVPNIPPPREFDTQEQLEPENQEQRTNENGKKTPQKKINMKSLLKEKIELKRKLVESTIKFQTEYIRLQEKRNQILEDIKNIYVQK